MDSKVVNGEDIFKCQECGACCKGFGGTYVSENDIEKISKYVDVTPGLFINKYCATSGSKYVLIQGKDDNCIFFNKEEQCTIHPVKPYMCRAWPFIKTIISNPENWNAMAGSCPGMQKNVSHDILKEIVGYEIKLL